MPKYRISSPDGRTFDITAPEGTTQDEVLAYAQKNMAQPDVKPENPYTNSGGVAAGLARGAMDPIEGLAQVLYRAIPEGIRGDVNKVNDWVAENIGIFDKMPEGGIDQMVKQGEEAYQAGRAESGRSGFDAARLTGNIAATLPMAYAAPAGASLGARVASGAVTGGIAGGAQPVYDDEGDFAGKKLAQAGMGAAAGAVMPILMAAASRLISPLASRSAPPATEAGKRAAQVQALQKEGVKLTPGEVGGAAAKRLEDAGTSIPIAGDVIKSSQRKSIESFNRAVVNRVLGKLGKKAPEDLVGNELVEHVDDALGSAYDDVLARLNNIKADPDFVNELSTLRQMAATYGDDVSKQFDKILGTQVYNKFTPQGRISGEQMKQVESTLSRLARGYRGSQDFDKRQLGDAIMSVRESLRNMVARSHPAQASELQRINQAYANYAIIRDAASRTGSKEGLFSPAQLRAAVRAADKSVGKGAFAKGGALLQDMADAGVKVMGQSVPDSGTPYRGIAALLAGGGAASAMGNPAVGAGLASIPLIYSDAGKNLFKYALTARPDAAAPVANMMMRLTPAASAGAASYAAQK